MASMQIKKLRKDFGALNVLRDISIDIEDGEFVALVGPSGCGKSTLLRMIAGLETISGGTISIGGKVVNDLQPKARDIAMVFQSYALYPHLTVAENMGFSLRLSRAPKAEIDRRVRIAAATLGLEHLLERRPSALSGGQRQRVAMGRAIVRNPQVFLFDEPLSNLDAKLRVKMRAEIKALHQQMKTTTIYVTHDQIEAMSMADKIVVLNGGHVEQVGAPLELYDHPANRFVAGFIGSPSMNQITGTCPHERPGLFVSDSGATYPLHEEQARLCAGRRIVLGVRPEHLALAQHGIRARVKVVEPTGSESLVTARLGDDDIVCVLRDRLVGCEGSEITLAADPDQLYLFDEASGKALSRAAMALEAQR
ncbi:sn-glycerol-3-phosphate ABC transporter ATP-binding protein UgpC [Martelella sp. HB161492]|uniref:ABC transporter ATP-binding protein n=1 Tax=Martelella sp. HB161492 TaxID=2720726 RepID=UPI001591416F|nr:sn-glycerol-3-phosphate ABC transporter ATP-binding protein UgpC [Martelella sp. HB161492]